MSKINKVNFDLKPFNKGEYSFQSFNCCSVNVLMNKMVSCMKGEDYKIVVGSLGFGMDNNPHYEYGFKKDKKNLNSYKNKGGVDVHCWLETPEGVIMDKWCSEYNFICGVHNKKVLFKKETIFTQHKDNLKRMGLHYKPIKNLKLQEKIFMYMNRQVPRTLPITLRDMKTMFH